MPAAKICCLRERLRKDAVGIGEDISCDAFFLMIRVSRCARRQEWRAGVSRARSF